MISKKNLPALLDGCITDRKTFADGIYRGYYITLNPPGASGSSFNTATISAHSESDPGNISVCGFLQNVRQSNKDVKGIIPDQNRIVIEIQGMTEKKVVAAINLMVGEAVSYMTANGYHSGCSVCGSEFNVSSYNVNGYNAWACPDCIANTQASFEISRQEVRSQKSDLARGILGAFLGSLAGAVLYVLVFKLGYVTALCGLAMAILSMFLYEKFGGYLDVKGIISCVIIMAVMVFFANKTAWAWEAYDALKSYGWTFSECFQNLPDIIKQSDLSSNYTSSLVMSYVFMALGAAGRFVRAIKSSTGNFRISKN